MITSSVYNLPTDNFPQYMYKEKRYVGVLYKVKKKTTKNRIVVVTKSMLFWIQRFYCELVTNDNFQDMLAPGGSYTVL